MENIIKDNLLKMNKLTKLFSAYQISMIINSNREIIATTADVNMSLFIEFLEKFSTYIYHDETDTFEVHSIELNHSIKYGIIGYIEDMANINNTNIPKHVVLNRMITEITSKIIVNIWNYYIKEIINK